MTLQVGVDVVFILVLIYYAIHIKHDWYDFTDPLYQPYESRIKGLWALTFIMLFLAALIISMIALTTYPLKERIY